MKKTAITFLLVCLWTATIHAQNSDTVSLRQQAAQMLIVGFRGTELTTDNPVYSDITELKVGGVIYFDYDAPTKSRPRNITSVKQLQQLSNDLQKIAGGSLFISIDQEGGYVNRLKTRYGFKRTISAKRLGLKNNADTTRYWSRQMAAELQKAGCNLNFAPSVDLDINPLSPAIGKVQRSFSASPDIVVKHARILIEEQSNYGIISAIKHFPGHGSSKNDSHLGMTDVSKTWREIELEPFRQLITEGVDMVMTSHVYNNRLDTLPATLSYPTTTTLLREQLGFKGVVVSDDIAMGAIADYYSLEFALEKSINAGVDIIILSNNGKTFDPHIARKAVDIICNLVAGGKIQPETIHNAYQRIINLKQKYKLVSNNE